MTDEEALDILRERRGRMYDPHVVDTFIRVYRDIPVAQRTTPRAAAEVMQRIAQSRHEAPAPACECATPMRRRRPRATCSRSSAWRASRRATAASPTCSRCRRIWSATSCRRRAARGICPDDARDRLVVADAFGPAAAMLRGTPRRRRRAADRLGGGDRQPIVNSDAALDLGERRRTADRRLLTLHERADDRRATRWSAC